MLLSRGSTLSNTWRTQRPPFRRRRRQLLFSNSCASLSKVRTANLSLHIPQAAPCLDEDCADFLLWLEMKAGTEISSVLSIGKSAYGRCLFACKPIRAGDCILKVPYSVQLSSNNLLWETNSLLGDRVSSISKVALIVLYEQKLGEKSEWAPYISRLPQLAEMHSTIFWSNHELEMIQLSPLYQETVRQKKMIETEFLVIMEALCQFPELHLAFTLEDFKYAYALVTSRAWESCNGVSMIPFADFLNHDSVSNSCVLDDEGKQLSEVIADRDYAPGDQVLIRYGKFSNAALLLGFGFTLPYNAYDEVQVKLNIPQQDYLSSMKLDLLSRHRMPAINDVNGFSSAGNSFTLKEVRSAQGKGRGIPQSFRAFARVMCSKSPQEINDLAIEAAENDGRLARRPLRDKCREIEAHQFLLLRITELIKLYNASIESLESLTSLHSVKKPAFRYLMAHDLLSGELRILKSAAEWLENYCAKLLHV